MGDAHSLHLVPTTPAPIEWLRMDEEDEAAESSGYSWMDSAMSAMRGCHGQVSRWYYGDASEEAIGVEEAPSSETETETEQGWRGRMHKKMVLYAIGAILLSVV